MQARWAGVRSWGPEVASSGYFLTDATAPGRGIAGAVSTQKTCTDGDIATFICMVL